MPSMPLHGKRKTVCFDLKRFVTLLRTDTTQLYVYIYAIYVGYCQNWVSPVRKLDVVMECHPLIGIVSFIDVKIAVFGPHLPDPSVMITYVNPPYGQGGGKQNDDQQHLPCGTF